MPNCFFCFLATKVRRKGTIIGGIIGEMRGKRRKKAHRMKG
jgi:hypothetical protein